MTDRLFEDADLPLLELSLSRDEHHKGTEPEFFKQYGTITKVYEDENGPILFVRGAKALRLDIQYVDNDDSERNKKAMIEGFPALIAKAKAHGFSEVIFNTNSRALRVFCKRNFGFAESDGELRKYI